MLTALTRKMTLLALAILASQVLLGLLVWGTDWPLGIPGEWTWQRAEGAFFPWIEASIIAVGFALAAFLVWLCDWHLAASPLRWLLLVLILAFGTWVDFNLMHVGGMGAYEPVFAVIDPHTGGYLLESYQVDDVGEYLRSYHLRLAKDADRCNHLDVHPPGNILFAKIARGIPFPAALQDFMFMPEMRKLMLDVYAPALQQLHMGESHLREAEKVVVCFCILATVARFLIFLSLQLVLPRNLPNAGLVAALLAFALGGQILFLGHFDALMFFLGTCCLFNLALLQRFPRAWLPCCLIMGALLATGVFFSLAFAVLIPGVLLFFFCRYRRRAAWQHSLMLLLGGLIWVAGAEIMQVRILQMVFYCARNNARFFLEAGRDGFWPPANFLDLLLFEGTVFVFPLLLALPGWKKLRWRKGWRLSPSRSWVFAWAAVILFLLFSSFSKGEMGRLLLFIFPFIAFLGCILPAEIKLSRKAYCLWALLPLSSAIFIMLLRCQLKLIIFF